MQQPLNPHGYYSQLSIRANGIGCYVTDAIWENYTLFAMWGTLGPQDGGMKVADGLAAALREGKSGETSLLTERYRDEFNEQTRRYDRVLETATIIRSLRLNIPEHAEESGYLFDKKRLDRRTIEVALYPKDSRRGSTARTFILILPGAASHEEQMELIHSQLNTRCQTIALAREWVEPLWEFLMKTNGARQLKAFGRFAGYRVALNELDIRRFISRELRNGFLHFPGMLARPNDLDEAA
jgi:hypothetical protein